MPVYKYYCDNCRRDVSITLWRRRPTPIGATDRLRPNDLTAIHRGLHDRRAAGHEQQKGAGDRHWVGRLV